MDTRDRVINAAIECIIDLGFYRGSSTNEIARRAGVTWGVIQHYFGNREGLMLAALEDGAGHMVETVEAARIDGVTTVERMAQLIDVFSAHYARPDYLASPQVLLNMDHDPRTSTEVRKTMLEVAERSHAHAQFAAGSPGPRYEQAGIGDHNLSRH
jgi:AcrR family transcriptional regulator